MRPVRASTDNPTFARWVSAVPWHGLGLARSAINVNSRMEFISAVILDKNVAPASENGASVMLTGKTRWK